MVGSWSRCSQTCGGGRKTRTVICKQRITRDEEVTLEDGECLGNRPISEKVCKRGSCPAMWMAEDWSEVCENKSPVYMVK